MRQTIQKLLLITFVTWHILAVGIYAIPPNAEKGLETATWGFFRGPDSGRGTVIAWIKQYIKPEVKPYMLATSQWQQWNLFSPDPLRRVTALTVDTKEGNQWAQHGTVQWDGLPWWQRATELSGVRRITGSNDHKRLRIAYLHSYCDLHDIPPRTDIRLHIGAYVIPRGYEELRNDAPGEWKERGWDNLDVSTRCT